jgi:hypothetical protein
MDDEHDLPTPEEIVEVTGGDPGKIRDGMRAFDELDDEDPYASENIGPDCGGCVDIRPPLRDYRSQDWHFEHDEDGGEAGED